MTFEDFQNLYGNYPDPDDIFYLEMPDKGVHAAAVRCKPGREMIVLAGSKIGYKTCSFRNDKQRHSRLRDELAEEGTIDEVNLLFRRGRDFDNPSAAACVVTGNSINGCDHWKDRYGRPLRRD